MKDILKAIPGTAEFEIERLRKDIKNVNENMKNHLIESIIEKEKTIRELEEDLECDVCLETAQSPIYCCQEQHLVCSDCRPKIRNTRQCPSCRVRYPGGDLLRHRAAERTAVRLGTIREELRNLTTRLQTFL